VIKHLNQFVEDAQEMSWAMFSGRHDAHVLVLIPSDETSSEPINTSEFAAGLVTTRPPIGDTYRVGILRKRVGGHPFDCFITIGRAKTNDIVLRDIEVSKVHAFFEEGEDGWTVRDNNSTNGTYHNGIRIQSDQKIKLRSSDTLKIGPGLSAVFFSPNDFYQFLSSPEVQLAFK
jgi:hypothetical protein